MKKCAICYVVTTLAAIGAINWALVAYLNMDLVAKILGPMTIAAKVVYGLVGVSGLILVISMFKPCPCCTGKVCK
jgi:uncharacterized protein